MDERASQLVAAWLSGLQSSVQATTVVTPTFSNLPAFCRQISYERWPAAVPSPRETRACNSSPRTRTTPRPDSR